jgi:hypothetical protein
MFGGVQYELFGINSSRQPRDGVVTLDTPSRFRTTASYLRGTPAKDAVKVAHHSIRILLNGANRFGCGSFPPSSSGALSLT